MIEFGGTSYYSAQEFADKVGVSKSYVCRLLRSGALTGKRLGVIWLLPAQRANVEWANRKKK